MSDELILTGPAPLRGVVRVPGDKGISHRALLFAAMARGRSRISSLAGGADVGRTRAALVRLGVQVTTDGDETFVDGDGVDAFVEPSTVIDCGNSGTTIRTLSGLVAGRPFLTVLTGDASLVERPMARVVDPLRAMGATVDGRSGGTRAPLVVRGGALRGRAHVLAVASAQVKTALVLAGLQASGVTEVTEPARSRDHTERMLGALGAPIERVGATSIRVRAGAPVPFDAVVPGDPSSAAFWAVGAAITPGSDVVVEGMACNPTRLGFVDVLRRMGAHIEIEVTGEVLGEPVGTMRVVASTLSATTIAGDEIPLVQDEVPVLAVAAGFADGVTVVRDAGELRVKESDRIATVRALLQDLGIGVEPTDDGLVITGGHPRAERLLAHGDHRIAMAAAIAANACTGESAVDGWHAADVSYPEFADHLALLTGARG
jgi:3-phosphoshikimate 1-carboxyvinyltransferase